jgi:hypothetical protein
MLGVAVLPGVGASVLVEVAGAGSGVFVDRTAGAISFAALSISGRGARGANLPLNIKAAIKTLTIARTSRIARITFLPVGIVRVEYVSPSGRLILPPF